MSKGEDVAIKIRIQELFEQYEDTSANEGWLLLRKKFPEKKKERGVIWWWAAAGLLLFSAMFLFLGKERETVTYNKVKKAMLGTVIGSKSQPANNPALHHADTGVWYNKNTVGVGQFSQRQLVGTSKLSGNTIPLEITINPKAQEISQTKILRQVPIADNVAATGKLTEPVRLSDSARHNEVAALNSQKKSESHVLKSDQTDPVLKMMAEDKAKENNKIALQQPAKKTSVVELSPYAATYFNYAKGSSNQVNVGAGVTTDFRISENIKLSTGVSIAQNTLSFDNSNVPVQAASSAVAYYSVSAAATSAPNALLSVNNYKANLIGLDIPINFKYQFNPTKNDTYISAGISSGTFINETYSSQVQYSSFFNSTSTGTAQVNSNSQHFTTFDFARTLNFSFGVGYPVGGNRLIVEPFLKYPIGGLGSQNLRFGASGINFKFNFSTSKK